MAARAAASEGKMTQPEIERVRREFADRIAKQARLESPALAAAFAAVPREDFVGPGPWKIMRSANLAQGYFETPDDDPIHLYDTVTVALDAGRHLNNGDPLSLARWLDVLAISPGVRFLHIGCGVGYYTALVAHAASPGGSVVAVEADSILAERARRNLSSFPNLEVRCAAAADSRDGAFQAIFVNAGATDVQSSWLDQLCSGGRLLVPLTVALPEAQLGAGHMLLIENRAKGFAARFVTPVGIFHCVGARSDRGNELLRDAFQRRGVGVVQSLRRDRHAPAPDCWLHASAFCLSSRPFDAAA
jgi:protein-L-isoaspartate(D-aspartate) O-methyltransferase